MTFQIEKNTLLKYEGDEEIVVLPEEVEVIEDYAFYGAKHLKKVVFHDHVREMGSNVFYNCENLLEAELPDSLYFMGSAVFSRCANLRYVRMSAALSAVPKITFFQCEKLEEVVLPARLRRMNRACFEQCHSLKRIALPETLKIMEPNIFDDCTALQEIHLPEGLEELGDNVFFNCCSLKRVNLPASLQKIGKGALETRGKVSVIAEGSYLIKAEVMDNNWNMNWNFGVNHRWNGKNEENYQLVNSYLPCVTLRMWKPIAQCVLGVNYLETYRGSIEEYDAWIQENKTVLLDRITEERRYEALNTALDHNLLTAEDVEPYLHRIQDREERAKLLNRRNTRKIDDLFDLL